jgi:hypothetical protein
MRVSFSLLLPANIFKALGKTPSFPLGSYWPNAPELFTRNVFSVFFTVFPQINPPILNCPYLARQLYKHGSYNGHLSGLPSILKLTLCIEKLTSPFIPIEIKCDTIVAI